MTNFAQLKRLPGWQNKLEMFLKDARDNSAELTMDWQKRTCGFWVADAIEVMTGVDLAEEYRGRVDSQFGALRLLQEEGFSSLDDLVASRLPEIQPVMAGRGDLLMVPSEDEGALANATALAWPPFYFAVGTNGLVKESIFKADGSLVATRAFKVG